MDEMNVMVNETVEETTALVPTENETEIIETAEETKHINKGLAIAGGLGIIGLGILAVKQGPKVVGAIKSKHANAKRLREEAKAQAAEKLMNETLDGIPVEALRAAISRRDAVNHGINETAEPIKVEVEA